MSKASTQDLEHIDFYESMVNSLPEGILWTDHNNVVIYSNDTAGRWLGFSRTDLLHKEIHKVIPSQNMLPWLQHLIKNPATNYEPLSFTKEDTRINVYAMVSIGIGVNHYNCFVLREEGAPGMDPNEMLRIISEGTASVIGGDEGID